MLMGAPASSAPPPIVVVRPLPEFKRPTLAPGYSKADLIAAMGVQTTTAYHPLGAVLLEDGAPVASPAAFSCLVAAKQLTVSYVREGFVTKGLPRFGTCGEGKDAVRFRIKVEPLEA